MIFFSTKKKQGVPLVSQDPGAANVKYGVKYLLNGVIYTGTYIPSLASGNLLSSNLPNVSAAMCDWFQPLVFGVITKKIVNFKTTETSSNIGFSGVIQPMSREQLQNLPNINYSWSYFTVHSCPKLQLKNDDIISYKGKKYRVQSRMDYSDYGYLEYTIILDYTGSDPV